MRFFVAEQLGPHKSLTPEGFLLCEGVAIARTGTMIYGPNETPVTPGADGLVKIQRDPAEVFREATIASFAGKPVTIEHPPVDVTPDNFEEYAVGMCLNPRRGAGIQDDLLVADLLITNKAAIDLIKDTDRYEVSCGYDAEYEEMGPGLGRQLEIIGNHLALVENGRCGSRCAILDHASVSQEKSAMNFKQWFDGLRKAVKARDEAGVEEHLKSGEGMMTAEQPGESARDVHVHVHNHGYAGADDDMGEESLAPDRTKPEGGLPGTGETRVASDDRRMTDDDIEKRFASLEAGHAEILKRIDALGEKSPEGTGDDRAKDGELPEALRKNAEEKKAEAKDDDVPAAEKKAEQGGLKEIEGELEEEAPEGTGDRARKARDSQYLEDSFGETLALAEVLLPGIKAPVFDKAAAPGDTFKAICALRRNALRGVLATRDGDIVTEIHGKEPDLDKMTCGAVRTLFKASAAMKKARNNMATRDFGAFTPLIKKSAAPAAPQNLAELNKLNQQHYAAEKR